MLSELDWMGRYCHQNQHPLKVPYAVELGGILWSVATNGKYLVAVQGQAGRVLQEMDKQMSLYKATVDYLTKTNIGRTVKLDDLRQWAGPATWPKEIPCDGCKGEKQVVCKHCEGTGENEYTECEECGHSHVCVCACCLKGKVECDGCDGSGRQDWRPPMRPGDLRGLVVDQELLARALERFESQTVMVERFQSYLKISGTGWIVVIMGLTVPREQVKSVFPEESDVAINSD